MTTPESYTLTRLGERLDRLNETVGELIEADARKEAPTGPNAELSSALGAIDLTNKVQTENIKALLDAVQLLARDIDEIRHRETS